MDSLKCVRNRFHLTNKVQIHHIIPKQHKKFLRNIGHHEDDPENLVFMPTKYGMRTMNLRPDRIVHDGGHDSYNKYVGMLLKGSYDEEYIIMIQNNLRKRIQLSDPTLPWL